MRLEGAELLPTDARIMLALPRGSSLRQAKMASSKTEAELLWRNIPIAKRQLIATNVWCRACRGESTVVDLSPTMDGRNLVLRGKCQKCGGAVVRLIETSEIDEGKS
jgi:hypothetical protein